MRALSDREPNIRRLLRVGDQSFLGAGLPSLGALRMLPLEHPDRKAVGGCGGAYWWHSPKDTLDEADASVLAEDTSLYATLAARLVRPVPHPYNFAPVARDFISKPSTPRDAAGGQLDFTSAIEQARVLLGRVERP